MNEARETLFDALRQAISQTLSEAEARDYFGAEHIADLERGLAEQPSKAEVERFRALTRGDPLLGETLPSAIHRAWLNDIEVARKCIPRMGPIAVRRALKMIRDGFGVPGAIVKARHDEVWP